MITIQPSPESAAIISAAIRVVQPMPIATLDAGRSRKRLQASPWLARRLPAGLLAEGAARLGERAMLDEELFPYLQGPGHSYWGNVARLLRQPGLITWKTWMLDSERRKIEIAKTKGPTHPLVAEELAVEALVNSRRPEGTMVAQDRFTAMTPKGQVLTILRHCLAGEERRARSLVAWIPQQRRSEEPYRSFLAWAARATCG